MEKGVFVYGYYGVGNLGDELLALSTYRGLEGRFETFYFRAFGDLGVLTQFDNVAASTIEKEMIESRSLKPIRLVRCLLRNWKLFKSCSRFIFGGGTTISGRQSVSTLFLTNSLLRLAKLRRLKIHAIGLGVLDADKWTKRMLLRSILSKVDSICARDVKSFDILKKYGHKKTTLATDLVFSLERQASNAKTSDRVAILTVAGPHVNRDSAKQDIIANYRAIIEHLVVEGFKVKLVAFQKIAGENRYDDLSFFEEVTSWANKPKQLGDNIEVITPAVENVGELFHSASLVIGHRFHSLILAAIHNIPFIGFFHEHKVTEICDVFGMPYYAVNNIDVADLKTKVNEITRGNLDHQSTLAELNKLSKLNFEIK